MKAITISIAACVAGLLLGAAAYADSGSFSLPTNRTGLSDTQDLISKSIHDATADKEEDPLKYITKDMGTIVGDLGKYQTDHPVQVKEQHVLTDLDAVIKKLEEQIKKGGAGGGSLNPTSPLRNSVIVGGPGGIRDLHDPKAGEKMWGKLPPKEREQILQSKTDGFPPGYESLLQSYYRRLAQEQTTGEEKPPSDAAPTGAVPLTAAPGNATTKPSP